MEAIKKTLQQGEKNHQTHQIKLQNMNEVFSKSLNDVLNHTSDKLIAQVKADIDKVLKSNIQAMENTVKHMEQTFTRVSKFERELKTTLIKRINAYNSSTSKLFKLDGWRHIVFWTGIAGGILTPIELIVVYLL